MECDLNTSNNQQEISLRLFKKRLAYLYKKIDSISSLLWSHDNHITGKRLRSEHDAEDNKLNWKNKETTQTGYGEISMASMTNLFNLFQNADKLIEFKAKELNLSNKIDAKSFNMTKDSYFLDIGSGFGKPVFHSAIQIGCKSHGIEVVPARVEFCLDFFYEFINDKPFFDEVDKKVFDELNNKSNTNEFNNNSLINNTNLNDKSTTDNDVNTTNEINNYNFKAEKDNINNISKVSKSKKNSKRGSHLKKTNNQKCFKNNNKERKYIYLNDLNCELYIKTLENQEGFIELSVNKDIINEYSFIEYISNSEKGNKSILIESYENSLIKFDVLFLSEEIYLSIIDDELTSFISSKIIQTINVDLYEYFKDNSSNIYLKEYNNFNNSFSFIDKIVNEKILDLLNYVNFLFNSKKIFYDFDLILQQYNSNTKTLISQCNDPSMIINYEKPKNTNYSLNSSSNTNPENMNDVSNMLKPYEDNAQESKLLKTLLTDLKFKNDNDWYKLTSFIAEDATIHSFFGYENKHHFTHIYAYNKLMSKECRQKIAKILNRTKFKILAWYSNPKQTKNSGLKNFALIAKMPMQSTSTEKFHVYVYIKTKNNN